MIEEIKGEPTIGFSEFCELHGKSYHAAKVNGIGKRLIDRGDAIREGVTLYIRVNAPWPAVGRGRPKLKPIIPYISQN